MFDHFETHYAVKNLVLRSQPALVAAVTLLLLTGCTVGPDYTTPSVEVPAKFKNSSGAGAGAAKSDDWWKLFKDARLNRLIDQAYAANRDLRASFQRVEQARAGIRVTRSELFPQIDTSAGVSRSRTSEEVDLGGGAGSGGFGLGKTISTYSLPVNAAWEIDLFGRVRRSTQAAAADAEAQAEDLEAMRLSVGADVASLYFRIRALDREIQLVSESVELRKNSVSLVQERFDAGAVNELDLAQANTQYAQSRAELAALQLQRLEFVNSLAVLVGAAASEFALQSNPLSGMPPRVPGSLPSELLRARPDIRKAERNLAAASARVGVAEAAFYPSVTLVGDVGVSAAQAGDLFKSSAGTWGINPSVSLPIFQGFRNKANLERSKAAFEEARELYEAAVLTAISEVESSLGGWRYLRVQTDAQSEAVESAVLARELTSKQYKGGLVSYLFVLDAERTALTTERNFARLKGDDFVNAVSLIRSIGGRW